MASLAERFSKAWNVFRDKETTQEVPTNVVQSYSMRPDRPRFTRGNERSIVTAIFNRIAIDVAAIDIRHVRLDENDKFVSEINSPLNNCFRVEANVDQTGRALIQDIVQSMFDEGVVAVVPIVTDDNPKYTDSFGIHELRVGKIVTWYPQHVRVRLYDEITGRKRDVVVEKKYTAIIENPLYSVINEPNSTMQRLIRKLVLLDTIDEQSGAGKLDMIISLPYLVRSPARKEEAEKRRKDIEMQLAGSKYGIAYTDGTEHITQLNRSLDNNILKQIEYLTDMLYNQLGMTKAIFDGTADEKAMLNYYNRTVEPILAAITLEMKRKFLTKTARTQRQSIVFFRNPFALVSVNDIAEMADKFTRNEIMSSNELRSVIGLKPVDDVRADELRNKNINQSDQQIQNPVTTNEGQAGENQNG